MYTHSRRPLEFDTGLLSDEGNNARRRKKGGERETKEKPYEAATDPNPYILNRCRMTKAKEEIGECVRRYTPAICISISPGRCVIHGKRSRTSRKQRVIRAIAIRQTHLNRESTATRHSLSTEEVKKRKRIRQGSGKRNGAGCGIAEGGRGGWASAKSSLISLRCLKKMSAEICRAIHLVDDDTPSIEHTRFLVSYVRDKTSAGISRGVITIIRTAAALRLMLGPALIITNTLIFLTSVALPRNLFSSENPFILLSQFSPRDVKGSRGSAGALHTSPCK